MSTVATLAVGVVADTTGFSGPIRRARGELRSFGSAADLVKGQLLGFTSGLAAAVTIQRFMEDVHQATEDLVQLGETAKRLDVAAGALAGLQHAAVVNSISTELFNKSLTIMEKNVGKNADAFADLHLKTSQLKNMRADEMFLTIGEAVMQLPTAAARTAAAMAVWGKGGAELLKLLGQGKDAIRGLVEEASRLGLAPSDQDLAKIQELDDAVDRLTESYKGLTRAAAIASAGTVATIAEMLAAAMGADTPAQTAWDNVVNTLPDDKFRRMSESLEFADRLPWLIRGPVQSYISSKSFNGVDVNSFWGGAESASGGNSFFYDSVNRRRVRDQVDAEAARRKQEADDRRRRDPFTIGSTLFEMAAGPLRRTLEDVWGGTPLDKQGKPQSGKSWLDGAGFLNGAANFIADSPQAWLFKNNFDAFSRSIFGPNAFGQNPLGSTDDFNFLGGNEDSAIFKAVAHMAIAGNAPFEATGQRLPHRTIAPGFSALEAGSAEGFAQERRSANASQEMTIHKQNLDESKKQTAQLVKIDTSIKQTQKLEIINMA